MVFLDRNQSECSEEWIWSIYIVFYVPEYLLMSEEGCIVVNT